MTKFRVQVSFKTRTLNAADATDSSIQHTAASFDVVSYGAFDDASYDVRSKLQADGIDLATVESVYIYRT